MIRYVVSRCNFTWCSESFLKIFIYMHRKKNEVEEADPPQHSLDEEETHNERRMPSSNDVSNSWYLPARLKAMGIRRPSLSNVENIPIALGFALMGTWFYILSLEVISRTLRCD
jgi:hypothetical protein